MGGSSNRRLAVVVVLLCCLWTATAGVARPAVTAGQAGDATGGGETRVPGVAENPCVGTVERPADGVTAVSVQGYNRSGKQPAMLVGVGPTGEILWVHHNGREFDAVWSYDVDPMENGNVFVTAAVRGGKTVVYEFDPRTQEAVWSVEFDLADTHDADLVSNGTEILVANMRNYNESAGENDARVVVYDREREEIVWQWQFHEQTDYEREKGADYTKAWVHVNDVDEVAPGRYLVSPRNFDQAVVVNRSTKEIELRLGSDNDYEVLNRPHNPDYLESENGTPTLLVADSHNDRVVEYAREGENWTRTWTLGSEATLDWPRDADRLPDGNTLVTDTKNQRVAEVTPDGTVVWEFYAPWLTYDAARLPAGEHGGPTARDLGAEATGRHEPTNSARLHESETDLAACHAHLTSIDGLTEAGRAFYGVATENGSNRTTASVSVASAVASTGR